MEKKEFAHQVLDLHKAAFENYFSMMVMFQDQTEKLFKPFLDHAPGMNDERKKFINEWTNEYKKNRDDFKKVIDDGYARVEKFFDYNALLKFQEQNEKIFNDFLSQVNWLPDDFRKASEELANLYKNGCETFRKYVEENVNHVNVCPPSAEKPQKTAKKRK